LGHSEELASASEARFVRTGSPKNRSPVLAAGQRGGKDRGLNHLAHEGFIKHIIGEHWNLTPRLGQMVVENRVKAYGFPPKRSRPSLSRHCWRTRYSPGGHAISPQ